MKTPLILVLSLLAGDIAAASEIPLPRPRPVLNPEAAGRLDSTPVYAPGGPPEPSACRIRLVAGQIAEISAQPAIIGPRDCGASDVLTLDAVLLPDKTRVAVTPPAMLRCAMAEAVVNWVREDVSPALAKLGATLRTIDNYDSFDCRGRNRIAGAKLSEHGRANALDVRGFRLASGTFVELTDRALSRDFREGLRRSVCERFMTVLGPGSDGYHETHIHLDLAERAGGYRLCRWDVLDPVPIIPLPRPRPKLEAVTVAN